MGTRRGPVLALLVVIAMSVAGCTGEHDGLSGQYRNGDTKNYISGNGAVTEFRAADRGPAVDFSARDLDGHVVRADEHRGHAVVVNFWFAACAPCRLEAADLEAVSHQQGARATFLGVDVRDSAGTARAFIQSHDVSYTTLIDEDAAVQLAFAGGNAPNATPSTIVLDKQGRVSARILGPVDRSVLKTLVDEANE